MSKYRFAKTDPLQEEPIPDELPIKAADEATYGAPRVDLGRRDIASLKVIANTLRAGHFTLTPTGLQAAEGATFEEWQQVGVILRRMDSSIQWLIGDWLNIGARAWGQMYEPVAEALGYDAKTLREYAYIARSIELSIRMDNLSFAHHQLVASLEPDRQRYWLQLAADSQWNRSQLRLAISQNNPNPTAPSKMRRGTLAYFERSLDTVWSTLQPALRKIGQGDRRQLAARLRAMADALDVNE